MAITLKTTEIEVTQADKKYPATLLEFEIEGGSAEPSELANLEPPSVDGKKGIVISGRGPVWLYSHLVHHYHVTKWVATYDPRLGGVIKVSVSPIKLRIFSLSRFISTPLNRTENDVFLVQPIQNRLEFFSLVPSIPFEPCPVAESFIVGEQSI